MNVTRETIRRDLRAMEQEHELIRTHGGAYILDGVQNDLDISTRQVLKTEEKKTIAFAEHGVSSNMTSAVRCL